MRLDSCRGPVNHLLNGTPQADMNTKHGRAKYLNGLPTVSINAADFNNERGKP